MNDQKRSKAFSSLGSDFDTFLFAQIGEEHDGMIPSVNSALARLNVDPWEEAAALVQLPQDVAVQRLATLIAALPSGPSARPHPEKIAERLIALLPRQIETLFPSRTALASAKTLVGSPAGIHILLFAMFIVVMAVGKWVAANSMLRAQVDQPPTPACTTGAPKSPQRSPE